MVRFSDIIKVKDKSASKEKPPESRSDQDKLWLSDSQIIKVNKEKIPEEPAIKENANLEIITYYEKFLERAIEIKERIQKDQGISPSPILSDLHYIIDKNLIDQLYDYAMSAPDDYDERLIQIVDVAFASLKVGKGAGYDTRRLLELGLAVFLENVGMYKIPAHILDKEERLNDNEIALIQNHPRTSFEILSRLGKRYSWLANVALQVHERYDGSGYPEGLKGDDILEPASIIGLIDTYIALIKKRPYRDKLVQTDAIKFIIKEAKGIFPAKILKIFLNQISLFPVNTHVRLNNKSIGRVISTDNNQPLRPTIELLYDNQGRWQEKRQVIRLSENPLLYITGSIDEKELPH